MLRSMYAGVSGLRNHQMKMDVLGNNIANINTVGYKGGRIHFAESLNQTLSNASPSQGSGYINPMQVGLGMKTTGIENLFNQGALENTGVVTDMALEGDGFFVLQGSTSRLFTRSGQFYFGADGRLVTNQGLDVQGWMVDRTTGTVDSEFGSGNLTNISVDPNTISEAEATQNVWFSGNLNAGLKTTIEVHSTGTALQEGTIDADAATELNNLDQTSIALVAGDTVEISGVNPDGTTVSATYTYAAGDTVQELLDSINGAFTGVTAAITDGNIVLTDTVAGDSETFISLSNGTTNTGTVSWPNFVDTEVGYTAKARTSSVVYDSLGGAHNVVIEFTKTTTDGQWTWETLVTGDETVTAGSTGTVQFDLAGNLTSFLLDGGDADVTIDPGNGAAEMHLILHAEDTEGHAGISQYDNISTLNIRDQDGRASGELVGLTIGRDGLVSGSFSNGEIESLAKLAVAKFPNNGGLSDLGNSLYQTSIASGDEMIVSLEEGAGTSIISGALEASNVDLSKELTEMIITQKGFEASAKVISTANQLLDELIRLKR